MQMQMRCARCGASKPVEDYPRDRSRKSGRYPYCKACVRGHVASYRTDPRYREREQQYKERWAQRWGKAHDVRASSARWRRSAVGRVWRRAYRRAHPELALEGARRRRERLRENGGAMSAEEWAALVEVFAGRCVACGAEGEALEADHVIPVVAGGSSDVWNRQPLCAACNQYKGARPIDFRMLGVVPGFVANRDRILQEPQEVETMGKDKGTTSAAEVKPRTMKALSIKQPWATMIADCDKVTENRSKGVRYRGPLLIHASKAMCPLGLERWNEEYSLTNQDTAESLAKELSLGAIIGVVKVIGCDKEMKGEWDDEGAHHIRLESAMPFLDPIPYRGKLGLFDVPEEVWRDELRKSAVARDRPDWLALAQESSPCEGPDGAQGQEDVASDDDGRSAEKLEVAVPDEESVAALLQRLREAEEHSATPGALERYRDLVEREGRYLERKGALEADISAWSERVGELNAEVRKLKGKIDEARSGLPSLGGRILEVQDQLSASRGAVEDFRGFQQQWPLWSCSFDVAVSKATGRIRVVEGEASAQMVAFFEQKDVADTIEGNGLLAEEAEALAKEAGFEKAKFFRLVSDRNAAVATGTEG